MRPAAILFGVTLSLGASAALACPSGPCAGVGSEPVYYDGGHQLYAPTPSGGDAWEIPDVWDQADGGVYMHGRRAAPACCLTAIPPRPPCGCVPEGLTLGAGFFGGAGGVGPIPSSGYYGGGYYIAYRGDGAKVGGRYSGR